ncbi:MAG: hypothetical protein AAF787_15325 [Chloroflexota bacterium]
METFDVDFTGFGAAISTIYNIITAILRRERGIIAEMHTEDGVLLLSLVVVFIAGLSERIGQSVVLFVNEVSPRRMVFSLVVGALLFVGGYVLWMVLIWAGASLLFRPGASFRDVAVAVGLGYAPLSLGFLALIPYFGGGILSLLYLWVFVVATAAVGAVLNLEPWQAVFVSSGGMLIILVVRSTIGLPLVKIARRIRNLAAGKRLELKVREAVEKRDIEPLLQLITGEVEQVERDNE